MSLTDVSVFVGSWPFRAHKQRTAEQLKAFLTDRGVTQAWVASSPAILYPDPMQGNEPLFHGLGDDPFFVKAAVIDVTLATWERDLLACVVQWGCRAVKLLPNYHQYDLADPRVAELAQVCKAHNLPLCIQVRMMDERGHHPLMKVPAVPVADITRLAERTPDVRFLVCGAYQGELRHLQSVENVWVETSFVESGHTLEDALRSIGPKRLVFGSHTPLLCFEAGAAKLDTPDADSDAEPLLRHIRFANAHELLHGLGATS